MSEARADAGSFLRALFAKAVAAADPAVCLPPQLPQPRASGRTCIIALGKAAAGMALAARRHFGPDVGGLVIVRHGCPVDTVALGPAFEVIHAGHPVPDAASQLAGERALELASTLTAQDRLLALISGGGSALAEVPLAGLSLSDVQTLTHALLASGAPIRDINRVRRALSRIKGGGLAAAAWPAEVVTCLISDVPGDAPEAVASGPTIFSQPDPAAALALLQRHGIKVPDKVLRALRRHIAGGIQAHGRPAQPGDVVLAASGATALEAAARYASARGIEVINLGDQLQDDAGTLARAHGTLVAEVLKRRDRHPRLILSGGETSVRLGTEAVPEGRGGRNLTYLLALALALEGVPGVHAIACDSDGLDGTSPAAGGIIDPTTLARAKGQGLDPETCLRTHDSHQLFERLGDLVVTGQTGTNVNDIRAILIEPAS